MSTAIRRADGRPRGCGGAAPLIGVLLLLGACGGPPTEGNGAMRGWGQPQVLADPAVFDSPVGVSLDGDGRGSAIAVWAPAGPVDAPVHARRCSARGEWTAVETVAAAGSGSVSTPTVQMNTRGDVVSMWDGYGGLRASASAAGGAWQSPVLVGRPASQKWSWGLDEEGGALVVWLSGRTVLTRSLEPGSGWGQTAVLPGAEAQTSALLAPTVAVSGSGPALAMWARAETLGGNEELWANSFDPRQGWATPHPLAPQRTSSRISYATVFVNASGDGLASWREYEAEKGVLYASRYTRATGFGAAEALGPSAGAATAASVDSAGNVLVIYQSGLGLRRQRYVAGRGWQPPEPLEDVGGYDAVPLDDQGNGWVLWNERIDSGTVSLRSRRLAAGVAAGPVEEVAPPFAGYAWFRGTPLDARGGLVAAWFQRVSAPGAAERYALVANRFLAAE
jgi:hypothetical protein